MQLDKQCHHIDVWVEELEEHKAESGPEAEGQHNANSEPEAKSEPKAEPHCANSEPEAKSEPEAEPHCKNQSVGDHGLATPEVDDGDHLIDEILSTTKEGPKHCLASQWAKLVLLQAVHEALLLRAVVVLEAGPAHVDLVQEGLDVPGLEVPVLLEGTTSLVAQPMLVGLDVVHP
jgi:hypothetical protein